MRATGSHQKPREAWPFCESLAEDATPQPSATPELVPPRIPAVSWPCLGLRGSGGGRRWVRVSTGLLLSLSLKKIP